MQDLARWCGSLHRERISGIDPSVPRPGDPHVDVGNPGRPGEQCRLVDVVQTERSRSRGRWLVGIGADELEIGPAPQPEEGVAGAESVVAAAVNTSSPAALLGFRGEGAYSAAKAAVLALTLTAADELGIPLNTAEDESSCDFHIPGLVEWGGIRMAISSEGANPAVVAKLRQELEAWLASVPVEQIDDLTTERLARARERSSKSVDPVSGSSSS